MGEEGACMCLGVAAVVCHRRSSALEGSGSEIPSLIVPCCRSAGRAGVGFGLGKALALRRGWALRRHAPPPVRSDARPCVVWPAGRHAHGPVHAGQGRLAHYAHSGRLDAGRFCAAWQPGKRGRLVYRAHFALQQRVDARSCAGARVAGSRRRAGRRRAQGCRCAASGGRLAAGHAPPLHVRRGLPLLPPH